VTLGVRVALLPRALAAENEHVSKVMPNTLTVGSASLSLVAALWLSFIEARPIVLMVFSLRFAVGGLLANNSEVDLERVLVGQACWLSAIWAIYLLNGLSDIDGDRANGSTRPLASGRLSTAAAISWCVGLATISIAVSVSLGWRFALVVGCVLVLGAAYSIGPRPLKNWGVAGLAVAAAGGFLSYFAGAISYDRAIDTQLVIFAFVASLWMFFIGHSKDLSDIDGDQLAGRRTLPIAIGARPTRVSIAISGVIVGTLGVFAGLSSPHLIALGIYAPASLWLAIAVAKSNEASREAARHPYAVFMIAQYAVNSLTLVIGILVSMGVHGGGIQGV
jgi:4-hydroxybenzoate polyprenyltransferase